jgi:hypothetical protein
VGGQKRFRGVLAGTVGEHARLRREDVASEQPDEVLLPLEEMAEAKLVLTDALVTESLKRAKAAERDALRRTRGAHWGTRVAQDAEHLDHMTREQNAARKRKDFQADVGTGSPLSENEGE